MRTQLLLANNTYILSYRFQVIAKFLSNYHYWQGCFYLMHSFGLNPLN